MDYGYAFDPGWEPGYEVGVEAANGIGAFVLIFLMAIAMIMLVVAAVVYVLQSVSLYAIAKRRGIKNPWLGWLPLGNMWIQGCIADQYQYIAKGKMKNRRRMLLILTAVLYVLGLINGLSRLAMPLSGMAGKGALTGVMMALMVCTGGLLAIASVAALVYQYIAMYDLYASCDPDNAVAFLILSIVLPISYPVLFFIVKNNDKGMPPRRTQTVQQTVETPNTAEPEMLPELVEE